MVIDNARDRRLEAQISAIARKASVISKSLGVIAKADLVICIVEISIASNKLSLAIALETGAGYDVEHSVSAIAVFCRIASALHFEIINIFWIELRAHI